MLVISRRISERVFIADNIVVTLVAAERGKVRLGIQAPPSVPVKREELLSFPEVEAFLAAAGAKRQAS